MFQAAGFLPPPHGAPASICIAASIPARPTRLPRSASSPSSKDHCDSAVSEDGLHRTLTTVSHLLPEPLDAAAVAVNELVVQKDGGFELRGNREPDQGG